MDIILKLVMKGKDCRVSRMIMKKNKARKIIKPYYAVLCLVAQLCLTICSSMDCSLPGSCVHGDSPGKNTGVSCHALLQGIFLTRGSNTLSLMSPALAGGFFSPSAT